MSDKGNSTWVEGRPTLSASDDNGTNHLVTHTLRAEGCDASEDGTGRRPPLVVETPSLLFIDAYACRGSSSPNQHPVSGEGVSDALDTTGPGAVAFKESQSGTREANVHATLDANKGSRRQEGIREGMMVRRLTPLECCRLQGFSDAHLDIDPPLSDSHKYRMLGNAVCVSVARWLGDRIREVLA